MNKKILNENTKNIEEENQQFSSNNSTVGDGTRQWEGFNLSTELIRGIYSIGFENPSLIQQKAIPLILTGKDLRAQAQSGTGKTGAFVIGSLARLDMNISAPQCLVLSPTREIAEQNAVKFREIGKHMNVKVCLLLGGTSVRGDIETLARAPHVIVGTPGRVKHMLEGGYLDISNIKIFILDEADEMLKIGFESSVREIFIKIVSDDLQSLLFSATYSEKELEISRNLLNDPEVIDLRAEEQTLQGIKQVYVDIRESGLGPRASIALRNKQLALKVLTLIDLFKSRSVSQVLVFVSSKEGADLAFRMLNEAGFPSKLITSNLTQEERNTVLNDFKAGSCRILVSSDLCKRGIDVVGLSIVVCLDVPDENDMNDYIHRVGRSGRYGKKGIALHILNTDEVAKLKVIGDHFHSIITEMDKDFSFEG